MELVVPLALVAAVFVLSALAAGLVERAPLSFPIVFLGLGWALGPGGFGVTDVGLRSPVLGAVAVVTLALVLFLDAIRLEVAEMRGDWLVPALTLGPGTVLIIAVVALAAVVLLGWSLPLALVAGAALASTDPVVLRDVLRDRRVPASMRRALAFEAGTNDLIVLPAVLILAAVASQDAGSVGVWAWFLVQLLVVGPVVGAAVGVGGAWGMSRIDRRVGVRSEYQAMYGIGLVLAAYAGGEWLGADGFLAAFAAGAAVTATNNRLCDCFLEFGEVVAEMLMLLAFVLFGVVLSSLVPSALTWRVLLLAAVVILAARPVIVFGLLSVRHTALSRPARAFIAWFGPRGLNSLLLALLVVSAGVPGAEELFITVGVVVTVSVLLHGVSATPITAWYARRAEQTTLPEEREATASGLFEHHDTERVPRIGPDRLAELLRSDDPPHVLDVRTRSSADAAGVAGSVQVRPDEIDEWAEDQTRDRLVVLYCT